MKEREKLRIYWFFWLLATIATGILAGFLTSHSIMLGRFFSWILENKYNFFFTDYFKYFRAETHANVYYNLFFWFGLIAGIGYTIMSFIKKKTRLAALIAGMSTFWISVVFFTWDFKIAEEAVSTGVADAATIEKFLAWNLPMHISFACFYTLSFIILLIAGFTARTKELKEKAK